MVPRLREIPAGGVYKSIPFFLPGAGGKRGDDGKGTGVGYGGRRGVEGNRSLTLFAFPPSAPPKKPGKDASPEDTARWEQQRHQQSSQRICIEHAIAEPKQWRPLQRYLGRREHFQETALAIAGLVSDRAAAR